MMTPDTDVATVANHPAVPAGKQICPRCQQWERENASRSYMSARSHSCGSFRGVGSQSRTVFKCSDPSYPVLPIFAQVGRYSLHAGRLPAVLPFQSRLFRRAHHSTKNARRWAVLNLSKPYIRAHHPRCELCGPCSPCILPFWAFVGVPHSPSPTVSEPREHGNPGQEDDFKPSRNADRVSHGSGASSQSSGFAETEREGPGTANRSALHCALPLPAWHAADKQTAFTGLEKDIAGRYLRPSHMRIDAVNPTGYSKPSLAQSSLRRSFIDGFSSESWHVVDSSSAATAGPSASTVCTPKC